MNEREGTIGESFNGNQCLVDAAAVGKDWAYDGINGRFPSNNRGLLPNELKEKSVCYKN